jgi:hypothetical protein
MTPSNLVAIFLYPALFALLTAGGNAVCQLILKRSGVRRKPGEKDQVAQSAERSARAGRLIGSIERILIMAGLVARSWEVLVAVIALKTVARYKELDEQIEAEYFLIGSLISILWALIVTLALIGMDQSIGFGLTAALQEAIAASD